MKSVKVSKKELLAIVLANKALHEIEAKELLNRYKKDMIFILKDSLNDFENDRLNTPKLPTKPSNYLDDYNSAIRILELSLDNEIVLDLTDFTHLVNDNWVWRTNFDMTKTMYGMA